MIYLGLDTSDISNITMRLSKFLWILNLSSWIKKISKLFKTPTYNRTFCLIFVICEILN